MGEHKQTPSLKSGNKDIEISLYKNCKEKNSTIISISDLFKRISTGDGVKEQIKRIRETKSQNERDELKQSLPAVTISGQFNNSRKKENLILYSGLIQIDLDKVENISEVRNEIEKDKYSYAVFLSPSGNGLKIIVRVSNIPENHLTSFLALEKHYLKNFKLPIDKSCKDITRLMFLSWDENIFVNEKANIFSEYEIQEIEFENVFNEFCKKETFSKGNRNGFCFKLASKCSQKGVAIEFTKKKFIEKFSESDFAENEIITTIKSAYSNLSNAPKNKIGNTENNNDKPHSKIKQVEDFIIARYELRNNEVSCKVEFRKKGTQDNFEQLNENNISRELAHNYLDFSLTKLKSLLNSDFVPRFNPFLNYFQNLKDWDIKNDIDFIEKLSDYLPVKNVERFKKQLKKMFVRCIACALDDSIFNKQAFILVHNEQNSGKSTFCRWLCPYDLKEYIAENINTDKDSQIALATNFIINMDELATLTKIEINTLKSFLSKDKINVRLPYDSRTSIKPRRANFVGSTNKDEFLTDESGSVRWLCFELTGRINFSYKDDIDINDIWRQAYTLYKQGFHFELTPEEVIENEKVNKQYLVNTPEMDLIPKYFKPATKEKFDEFLSATDVLNKIAIENPKIKFTSFAVGKALKILGYTKDTKYHEKNMMSLYGYYVFNIST